jgi:Lhr-like helicase
MDISNIELVVQWRASTSICSLWQRFGRGACQLDLKAVSVLLVEPKWFDKVHMAQAEASFKCKSKADNNKKGEIKGIHR